MKGNKNSGLIIFLIFWLVMFAIVVWGGSQPAGAATSYVAPRLNCGAISAPGWINDYGDATACVDNNPTPGTLPTFKLVPCKHTYSTYNCYWDAAKMGDGTGRSFVRLQGFKYYKPYTH